MTSTGEKSDSRRWLLVGLSIGLLGIAIRMWLHQQPVNSDDVQYFDIAAAHEPGRALTHTRSANGLRLVLLSISSALVSILPQLKLAFYATIYTFALVSFAGFFAFAWATCGARIAAIASAVWALSYVAITVDTRLTPDNLGTGLALFGLALITLAGRARPRSSDMAVLLSNKAVIACAVAGGFFLWAASSVRASFLVFAIVGLVFALLCHRRWYVTGLVLAGLVLGELVELWYFEATFGDPLTRWKMLLGYSSAVTSSGSSGGIFSGYSLGSLFTRYPELLAKNNTGELVVHFVGLGAFALWAIRWRDPQRRMKALCGWLVYGFIAFAVVSVDPLVPLMREKLRYYATAAPLFYIAFAELIDLAVFRHISIAPRDKWIKRNKWITWCNGALRHRAVVAVITLLAFLNIYDVSQGRHFAKNGNDGLLATTELILEDSDAAGEHRLEVFYTDPRTKRVTKILLPASEGWSNELAFEGRDTKLRIPQDGYLLLNWKRLNANVKSRFAHGNQTHQLYRIIETYPLVARHRRGSELIDVFVVGKNRIDRQIRRLPGEFPRGWARWTSSTGNLQALEEDKELVFTNEDALQDRVYMGDVYPWLPQPGTTLEGNHFVQAVVVARSNTDKMRQLHAYLHWWPTGQKERIRHYMGRVFVGPKAREYAFWTYLPRPAESPRVVLRAESGVVVSDVQRYTLERHEADRLQQRGGAWSE